MGGGGGVEGLSSPSREDCGPIEQVLLASATQWPEQSLGGGWSWERCVLCPEGPVCDPSMFSSLTEML